jgi:hypothetical protein
MLLIDDEMLQEIVNCTIKEAKEQGNVQWNLTTDELLAFMGLVYARGFIGAKNIPLDDLWSRDWGSRLFSETMSRQRFREILRFLRFDVKRRRSIRLKDDKFALFSFIWNRFISNCQEANIPEENITRDEQLFPTKSRCKFTQNMPNKPGKFGIKFWLMVEVSNKYLVNGFPYLGKDSDRLDTDLGQHVVMKLMKNHLDKGYNVTADNVFTLLSLVKKIREHNTTYVGTLRLNRREVPRGHYSECNKAVRDTIFYLSHDGTLLTSYKAKKNLNVLLLSSRHQVGHVNPEESKKKPDTVLFYNSTKFGVDTFDQMARSVTTKSGSRRWPLACMFNMMDFAAINAFILFKVVTGRTISRREFMKTLIDEMVSHTHKRCEVDSDKLEQEDVPCKRRQCSFCRNKTAMQCEKCEKHVCGKCSSKSVTCVCSTCL